MRFIRTYFLIFVSAVLSLGRCEAADLIFVGSDHSGVALQQVQTAAGFYGTRLKITSKPKSQDLADFIKESGHELTGLVVAADVLEQVNEADLLRVLKSTDARRIPVLILGIQKETAPSLLKEWSNGQITGCAGTSSGPPKTEYRFEASDGLTFQLAHVHASAPGLRSDCSFTTAAQSDIQSIEALTDGGSQHPVFARTAFNGQQVFFASGSGGTCIDLTDKDVVHEFLKIAPAMIFVRFCVGESGWHSLQHYANFTIDDPWLREPYGFVDYEGLLREMEEHHFHTTIAFIPWNYDRSQSQVVSLFKSHPAEYSIAVHGDNHDHKEFTDYASKPLALQLKALDQAIARMDKFHKLTGIPYDRVMVFPHSIAPEQTLGALKSANLLATVNSNDVPQGSADRRSAIDRLRPVTLHYEGFSSIQRYSTQVEISPAWIAVNQFLGNPLFFYDHADFFAAGIAAFDHVADDVNQSDPSTKWSGLAEIARHLYLIKLRSDGDYDVRALSGEVDIRNTSDKEKAFHIEKEEGGTQQIQSVFANGEAVSFVLADGKLSVVVKVPAGESSVVRVQYVSLPHTGPVEISHDSMRAELLRRGSDFRDIYLAKAPLGLRFIRFYTDNDLTPRRLVAYVLGCLMVLLAGLFFLRMIYIHRVIGQKL